MKMYSIYSNLITSHFVVYMELYVSPVKSLSLLVNCVSGHPSCYFYRQMASPMFSGQWLFFVFPVLPSTC